MVRISPEKRSTILDLGENGTSSRDIAEAAGVSLGTVEAVLTKGRGAKATEKPPGEATPAKAAKPARKPRRAAKARRKSAAGLSREKAEGALAVLDAQADVDQQLSIMVSVIRGYKSLDDAGKTYVKARLGLN